MSCGVGLREKVPREKVPKARVTTREVGTRAFGDIGPILVGNLLWGLGPPRSAQHRACLSESSTQTVWIATVSAAIARPTGRHGGFPTGRPWGFAYPDPCLGSGAFYGSLPIRSRALGPARRRGGELSSRVGGVPQAATLTRIALAAFLTPRKFGWPRRWPPVPAVPAVDCFARPSAPPRLRAIGNRTRLPKPFPISPVSFLPDDGGKNIVRHKIRERISTSADAVIHRLSQTCGGAGVVR